MRAQQPNATAARGAPPPLRSWRLLLLFLLVLLPVTVVLASPEPAALTPGDTAEQRPGVHTHDPSDTPVCHHHSHHGEEHVLVSHNREAELPAPDDNVAAIPGQGTVRDRSPISAAVPRGLLAPDALPTVPIYLLTRRLRV